MRVSAYSFLIATTYFTSTALALPRPARPARHTTYSVINVDGSTAPAALPTTIYATTTRVVDEAAPTVTVEAQPSTLTVTTTRTPSHPHKRPRPTKSPCSDHSSASIPPPKPVSWSSTRTYDDGLWHTTYNHLSSSQAAPTPVASSAYAYDAVAYSSLKPTDMSYYGSSVPAYGSGAPSSGVPQPTRR